MIWAVKPTMNFHTIEQVHALSEPFTIELLREVDEPGQSFSGPKRWHYYDLILRRSMG